MNKNQVCCENCKFFIPSNNKDGACLRYPPQIVPIMEVFDGSGDSAWRSEFPEVDNGDWCGEFKEIEKVILPQGGMITYDSNGKAVTWESNEQ